MKNLFCHNLDELHDELHKAIARLRRKTNVTLACFHLAHLSVQVWFLIVGSVVSYARISNYPFD
jgi:hypothetical protein